MSAPLVLGISSHFHDSAAALVDGDRILAAAQEERFSRVKADWRFPEAAIAYCLSCLPEGRKPDRVAYFENPVRKVRRMVETAAITAPRGARLWPRLVERLGTLSDDLPRQLTDAAGAAPVSFVPHHRSHAASAFYPSPFESAAVLVMDGVGEVATTTIWNGTPTGLEPVAEIRFPHSLGLFYSAFTQYCGFKVNSGEYKLMGLAPFGAPSFTATIRNRLIDLHEDGGFSLNLDFFDHHRGPSVTSPLFEMLFRQPARRPQDPITPFYMNIAASAQRVLERAVLSLAAAALARTGQKDLCLAGGVALNCVANGRLRRELDGLRGLWVQPAAGDAGGALGAALEVARAEAGPRPAPVGDGMSRALLGPRLTEDDCRAALDAAGLTYDHVPDPAAYAERVAQSLAAGEIVGHADGPMEFGPRALGNRSVLADPRGESVLSHVNRRIKFREGWRPFAPLVLADAAPELFDGPTESPYMLHVATLKKAYRLKGDVTAARASGKITPAAMGQAVHSQFDAVTHVDHGARLQTIERGAEPRAAAILTAFHALTGCPMLLNSSFNVRGEPIICSAEDAVDGFLHMGLDLLALGPFLVRRDAQPDWIDDKLGKVRFAED
ncbi:carbamoyltransferase family protein [Jannaschia seohaensis]|uniref:Carbamoyltransferase n=1 Tax=Jannaschia seohaensis TaxID=475081 RepID=A0A2Y9B062_9RHOB|nr:carbamoyltransferase N-terminal domain-containing protein [Jannaschia seohaensis]PWJ15804.1 carbamoyltransferase [Jannaschia seohaensis]SSA49495.1 carbamoyltransferase [Jannaschia seohaensis]